MEAATGPRLVPGYEHIPGHHCGSTALRNLLAFHGLRYSEEMAFGLGAGASFFYFEMEGMSPSRFTNGRGAQLERSFIELTGAPLALETAESEEEGWEMARATIDSGRPALLLTDLYYLDHYGKSAHFPGHAVVLAGYDDEFAYLSDTAFEELQTTRLENLSRGRYAKHPASPLSGEMIHLPREAELTDLQDAVPGAVARAARDMLEPPFGKYQGIPALRRLAEEAGGWPEQAEDWQWCARFGYQVIERRGTGGGNFRRMYARFLEETGYRQAGLAAQAADRWTELAEAFHAASESEQPEPEPWRKVGERSGGVLEAEERLWSELADG